MGLIVCQRAPRSETSSPERSDQSARKKEPFGVSGNLAAPSAAATFGSRQPLAGQTEQGAFPQGRHRQPEGPEGGTPGAATGWNKPVRLWKEQTPEGVRNTERGTNRDLGTPGRWTSRAWYAGGEETLREPVVLACECNSCLRPYSEEEAEAHERRALCVKHSAGRSPGMPQEPREAEGVGLKPR